MVVVLASKFQPRLKRVQATSQNPKRRKRKKTRSLRDKRQRQVTLQRFPTRDHMR